MKPIPESFVQYQTVWDSGAIGNLYIGTGTESVELIFPVPVELVSQK